MHIDEFETLDSEVWMKVPFLPPHIEVSSLGRLRKYVTPTEVEEIVPKVNGGYAVIGCNGKYYGVHRLVAETFIPKPDIVSGKLIVRHKNGIKTDNRVENLKWASNVDNFSRNHSWETSSRKKIYCKYNELEQVFGTLRSAAYLTQLPQDVISDSIKNGYSIAGYTFSAVEADDPILAGHTVLYIDFERMIELSRTAKCEDELRAMLRQEVENAISSNE